MADTDSRSGVTYIRDEILEWANRIHAPHDGALAASFEAPERLGLSQIQVSPLEGRLLALLLKLVAARKVVEVGTLTGYSALHMARSLPEGGRLWTIESDPVHAAAARESMRAGGIGDRVEVVEGPALDVLPGLELHAPFDAVFIDADKGNYDRYGRWAGEFLRSGGLLLADNAFYFGRILENDPAAEAVRRFHEETARTFDSVCIPTPDGLILGIRK
jgi:caffeoyl-CoA O-methyltransferase